MLYAEFDRPLSYYDESGALAKQCVILATFNSEPKKKRRLDLSKKATVSAYKLSNMRLTLMMVWLVGI